MTYANKINIFLKKNLKIFIVYMKNYLEKCRINIGIVSGLWIPTYFTETHTF